MENKTPMIDLAAQIVAAYVTRNAVEQGDLPRLIADVHRALELASTGQVAKEEAAEVKPAINIKKSITPDYLICLEDGKKFKSLKRWPVTVSYYDRDARSKDGEQTPVYAMSFELFENGVSRALVLDYNDFVISGAMGKFDVKDSKPCK